MTQHTRTVSRIDVAAKTPAWVAGLTATNTLYEIGDLPTVANAKIVWPAAGAQNSLYTGTDGNYVYMHVGYGGSVFVPNVGMVFGQTGEAVIVEQLTVFTLYDDVPTWNFLQQPDYAITSAEAVARSASGYYSPSDYAALPSGNKIPIAQPDSTYVAWEAAWNSGGNTFPVGYDNWVFRQQMGVSMLGNQRPHWFRYEMPCYLPPSMTGTEAGAILVNEQGWHGPWNGTTPPHVTEAQWFANAWGSGRKKNYLSAMDLKTGMWTRLAAIPDFVINYGNILSPISIVDVANKRVTYTAVDGSNNAFYYADFTSGLSGVTISTSAATVDHSGGAIGAYSANHVTVAPTSGPCAGRVMMFIKNADGVTPALLMYEPATNSQWKLTIGSLPPSGTGTWGLSFDTLTNTLYITNVLTGNTSITTSKATLPTDPTSAANWSFSSPVTLSLGSGVTLEDYSGFQNWQGGERSKFLNLGGTGVILITQHFKKMLAYRPA